MRSLFMIGISLQRNKLLILTYSLQQQRKNIQRQLNIQQKYAFLGNVSNSKQPSKYTI